MVCITLLPPGPPGNLSPLQEISESELDDSAISVSDFMRCTEKDTKMVVVWRCWEFS